MLHYSGKKWKFIIGFLFIANFSIAQLSSLHDQQLWIKADDRFDYGDYMNALQLYTQLNHIDSTNEEIIFKIAVCNFNIRPYRKKSIVYFNKINTSHFPESNYYLGRLCALDRQYNKAIEYFTVYKNSKKEMEHTVKEMQDLIDKCTTAIEFEANKKGPLHIENLGSSINTSYAEYAPLIDENEDRLLFTSRRENRIHLKKDPLGQYFEDIYVSKKNADTWGIPLLLDTVINTSLHDACTGLSADGKRLLIYRTSQDLKSGDIYESLIDGEKYSTPQIITTNVNSKKYIETSACFSPDNNTIFFSSDRPGGYGGKDIYFMKKLANGKWGTPFNLGPIINTPYNEDAPFVHPLNNTLFFSSEGHKNMGGFDIFKSNFSEEGNFTEPENLGCPINTSDDDIFFVLNKYGTTGYFSSEREGGFGSQDIYKATFVPALLLNVYHATVLDKDNNVVPKAELTLIDKTSSKTIGVFNMNSTTEKILIISNPEEYKLQIRAPGFETYISTVKFGAEMELTYKLTEQSR
jgi:hypothetical protein